MRTPPLGPFYFRLSLSIQPIRRALGCCSEAHCAPPARPISETERWLPRSGRARIHRIRPDPWRAFPIHPPPLEYDGGRCRRKPLGNSVAGVPEAAQLPFDTASRSRAWPTCKQIRACVDGVLLHVVATRHVPSYQDIRNPRMTWEASCDRRVRRRVQGRST
jgi:hypothetical protein